MVLLWDLDVGLELVTRRLVEAALHVKNFYVGV